MTRTMRGATTAWATGVMHNMGDGGMTDSMGGDEGHDHGTRNKVQPQHAQLVQRTTQATGAQLTAQVTKGTTTACATRGTTHDMHDKGCDHNTHNGCDRHTTNSTHDKGHNHGTCNKRHDTQHR